MGYKHLTLSPEERREHDARLAKARRDKWNAKVGKRFLKEYHIAYREANRERFRERHRLLSKRTKPYLKPKARLWKKMYDREYLKKHASTIRLRRAAYYQNNKDKAYETRHRLRAIRRGAVSLAGQEERKCIRTFIKELRRKRKFCCYYCKKQFSTKLAHIDHIVAIAKGGEHAISNLCASCKKCNLSKHAQSLREWTPECGQAMLPI